MAGVSFIYFSLFKTFTLIFLINFCIIIIAGFDELEQAAAGDGIEDGGRVETLREWSGRRDNGAYHQFWLKDLKYDESEVDEDSTTLIRRLLVGIEKGLDLFAEYSDELLVDALLGVRISIDQLSAALNQMTRKDSEIARIMGRLINRGRSLMDLALPQTRDKFDDFQDVGSVLDLTWEWARPRSFLAKHLSSRTVGKQDAECAPPRWNESISDHCLSEILQGDGSYSAPSAPCLLTDGCVERLFHRCHGYALTHQALYIMIGIKCGCSQALNTKLKEIAPPSMKQTPTIDSILEGQCEVIYQEASIIQLNGYPTIFRDIFIEQGVMCGLLNYMDFFRLDWVKEILSWQHDDGCFGRIEPSPTGKQPESEPSSIHHREKRRDLNFKHGCSSHTTSLAISYFSIFVRHITRQ